MTEDVSLASKVYMGVSGHSNPMIEYSLEAGVQSHAAYALVYNHYYPTWSVQVTIT